MAICRQLTHSDRGSRPGECGRPAKWLVSGTARGICGIHARYMPEGTLVPLGMGVDRLTGRHVFLSEGK